MAALWRKCIYCNHRGMRWVPNHASYSPWGAALSYILRCKSCGSEDITSCKIRYCSAEQAEDAIIQKTIAIDFGYYK